MAAIYISHKLGPVILHIADEQELYRLKYQQVAWHRLTTWKGCGSFFFKDNWNKKKNVIESYTVCST